ncbi:MAG TPA: DUF1549 and DUF1553 domain-containing protein [Planctomycetaceae bacterium]
MTSTTRGTLPALVLFCLLVSTVPADEAPSPAEPPLTAADREHWAFRPLSLPKIPAVKNEAWCRSPVDQFILAKLEAAGLAPLPQADRRTLIRRVTFDLTGLPPTPAESDGFVEDSAPNAYERLIDRLLESRAYGERWAQHWLDLVRFAETDGFEHDLERPQAWRYRDWVIDALNIDMPYDKFVQWQLAGDEIHPDDAAACVATGFLLCGPDMPDINLLEERRHVFLNDMTGTVSSVLLGLNVGCAQCHDHKFDPISQYDFYRLRAFFDPADIFKEHPLPRPPGTPDPSQSEPAIRLKQLTADVQSLEEAARKRLKAENPDLQPTRDDILKAFTADEKQAHETAAGQLEQLKKTYHPPEVSHGRTVQERMADLKPSHYMVRGDFRRVGPEVSPSFLRIANVHETAVAGPAAGAATTGRRSQLAQWVTAPDNPLTSRVIVNRLWQHYFGRGLVETSGDFGKMGSDPSHPELLDWLASELPRQGWSLKSLHKLLVTSAVYRQESKPVSDSWKNDERAQAAENWKMARRVDPDNRLLARMNRKRMEGEAIRDAMLSVAGRLSLRQGGPGVRPPLPAEVAATLLNNKQWIVSPDAEDHRRRSIYLFVRRNLRYPLFDAFDRPDTNASCPRRNRSTIAPQALILLNSEFSLDAARHLAGFILAQAGPSPDSQIKLAYRCVLSRLPTQEEFTVAVRFLENQAVELKAAKRPVAELALPALPAENVDPFAAAALTDFCLALFNLNEFVYVD